MCPLPVTCTYHCVLTREKDRKRDNSYKKYKGGRPGLVVMGGDSWPEGRGFESQICILLDGHFSHIFVVKIVMFV